MGSNQNNSNQIPQSSENEAAQLAFIGALISTLGDGISTIAAALALQEAQQAQQSQNNNNNNNSDEIRKMQKQIDVLSKEMKHLKRMLIERK